MDYVLPPMNPELARVRRVRMRQRHVRAVRFVRFLWGIAVLLFALLLVEAVVVILTSPRFWVYRVDAPAADTLTTAEIIRLAAVPPETNYYSINLGAVSKRIEAGDPRVHRAHVRKGAVGVLDIRIEERQPLVQLGHGEPPRYLDADSVLFTRPGALATPVPVVEGLPRALPTRAFGARLGGDARIRAVQSCLREMDRLFAEFGPLEIARVVLAPNGRMTLVLRQGTRIMLGDPIDFYTKLYAVRGSIIDASKSGFALQQLEYIDVSNTDRPVGMGAVWKERHGEEGAAP